MDIVSDVLHRLGTQGAGAHSLSIAINTRSYFDDVRIKPGMAGHTSRGPPRTSLGPQDPFCLLTTPRHCATCDPQVHLI